MESWNCKTYHYVMGCGSLYVTIDEEHGKPIHCFVQNRNGCTATINALARMISNDLEDGSKPLKKIAKPLKKTVCAACMSGKEAEGKSCCQIVAEILESYSKKKVLESPF